MEAAYKPKTYKTPPPPPLSAALGFDASKADVLLRLAAAQLGEKRHDEALLLLEVVSELVSEGPLMFDLHSLRAMALARGKEYQSAVQSYLAALNIRPNDLECWTDLGEAYVALGEYQLAAQALKQAMQIDPKAEHPSGRRARAIAGRTTAMLKRG